MSLILFALYFVFVLSWVFAWLLFIMIVSGYKTLGEWARGTR